MLNPRQLLPLLAIATTAFFCFLFYSTNVKEAWRGLPQVIGLGDVIKDESAASSNATSTGAAHTANPTPSSKWRSIPHFEHGTGKPIDFNFTKVLVIPHKANEDVQWIEENLPEYQTAIYVVDNARAPLHPPKNKGHEVMVYLSWIIDNYEKLPDVAMFMHAHRWTWHNNVLLDFDAVEIVKRLNPNRVLREGYVNLRCHWDPGCPDWMHPGEVEDDKSKHEQKLLAKAWSELFPMDPIPNVLAQPCCSQFAVSSERIRAIPLQRFVSYRDWLLRTPLPDSLSGRIWEYIWQYVFTGENVVCPNEHVCYCDGYGVCFDTHDDFSKWKEDKFNMQGYEYELHDWHEKEELAHKAMVNGEYEQLAQEDLPAPGRDKWLELEIYTYKQDLIRRRDEAIEKGNDPRKRAEVAGREWREGDWF